MNFERFDLLQDNDRGLIKVQQAADRSSLSKTASKRQSKPSSRALQPLMLTAAFTAKKKKAVQKAKNKTAKPSKTKAKTKKPAQKAKSKAQKTQTPSQIEQQAKRKEKFGLIDFSEDITQMSLDKLREHFGYISGSINKALFVSNVIWQLYRMVQRDQAPAFIKNGGNVRSLWYYVKKVVQDHPRVFNVRKDMDGLFSKQLAAMVRSGLLSYKDLNITDDRESFRRIAPIYGNPHIILIGEKFSFLSKLIEVWLQYGITIQCSKGMPSLAMADGMITEMGAAGYDLSQEFIILAFTDFDPAGWLIGNTFARHLKELGIKNIRQFNQYLDPRDCLDVVCPHDLSAEFLERARNTIKTDLQREPLTRKWANSTGGVYQRGGTNYAISAEEHMEFFDAMLAQKIAPFLVQKPEVFTRMISLEYLSDIMGQYLLERVLTVKSPE